MGSVGRGDGGERDGVEKPGKSAEAPPGGKKTGGTRRCVRRGQGKLMSAAVTTLLLPGVNENPTDLGQCNTGLPNYLFFPDGPKFYSARFWTQHRPSKLIPPYLQILHPFQTVLNETNFTPIPNRHG